MPFVWLTNQATEFGVVKIFCEGLLQIFESEKQLFMHFLRCSLLSDSAQGRKPETGVLVRLVTTALIKQVLLIGNPF